jgi:ubiquinone/menaquinone biosynthesis C-methylase UbiE
MNLSREAMIFIKRLLDDFLPPVLRDSRLFMFLPYFFAFRKDYRIFYQFREEALKYNEKQIAELYERIAKYTHGGTDLNEKCFERILRDVTGGTFLEVACGRGLLAKRVRHKGALTAVDIVLPPELIAECSDVKFVKANVESLPFKDNFFDTVITTHTLEHTINIEKAVKEVRRVARKRLIVVLPKEKPYKFGFNLHLHFFPYQYFIRALFGYQKNSSLLELGGDWYYWEDYER